MEYKNHTAVFAFIFSPSFAGAAQPHGFLNVLFTLDVGKRHFRAIVTGTNSLLRLSAAFIAALYIDKDLEYVHTFMNVCFFPRLKVSPRVADHLVSLRLTRGTATFDLSEEAGGRCNDLSTMETVTRVSSGQAAIIPSKANASSVQMQIRESFVLERRRMVRFGTSGCEDVAAVRHAILIAASPPLRGESSRPHFHLQEEKLRNSHHFCTHSSDLDGNKESRKKIEEERRALLQPPPPPQGEAGEHWQQRWREGRRRRSSLCRHLIGADSS